MRITFFSILLKLCKILKIVTLPMQQNTPFMLNLTPSHFLPQLQERYKRILPSCHKVKHPITSHEEKILLRNANKFSKFKKKIIFLSKKMTECVKHDYCI